MGRRNKEERKTLILEFLKKNKRRPNYLSKSKKERNICADLMQLATPNGSCYEPEFREKISKIVPFCEKIHLPAEERKISLLDFVFRNGRVPSTNSLNERELKISFTYRNYVANGKNHPSLYDPELEKVIKDLIPSSQDEKSFLFDFCKRNGRYPRARESERALVSRYLTSKVKSFDFKLLAACEEVIQLYKKSEIKKRQEVALDWIKKNRRHPKHPCSSESCSEIERLAFLAYSEAKAKKEDLFYAAFVKKVRGLL